jgi:hypothetical protein
MLPPNDWFERLARGAFHPEEIDAIADRLASDPALAARFADFVAADPLTAALAAAPPDPVPDETLDRVLSGVLRILSAARDTATRTDPGESTPEPDAFPHRSASPPPTKLGGYRIRRELGRGGMGVVYEAEDEALGRLVALKTLKPVLAAAPQVRERFLREARAQAAVEHPNVVPIFHIGEDDGVPYAVMPLLHGETLQTRLDRKGRLSAEEVIRIGRDVAAGLEAAHAKALIHRDLKPANIWLDADSGRALVLDFGLAVPSDGTVPTDPSAGTPTYMSPEQARGEPLDHRTDLFALGVVLYRATTGRPAFVGSTLSTVLTAVAEHHPDPPAVVNPSVPPRLSALILQLLAKSPADRPATAQHVVAQLDRMGAPALHPTRRKWVIGGVLFVLLGGAAVGIWAVARAPDAPDAPVDRGPGTTDPPVAPQQKDPPGPRRVELVKYSGSLDLYVYRKDDDNSDRLLPLWKARAMPLRPGDQVKPIAKVDPPAYLYVFWIDEMGAVVPLYPWRINEWNSRPVNEQPVAEKEIMWNGKGLQISGTKAGTETVLMLARPTKLEVPDNEVRKWFDGLPHVPFLGDKAHVWFEDFDVVRDDPNRAPEKIEKLEGVRGLHADLRERLGSQAPFSRAVSFSRRGAK